MNAATLLQLFCPQTPPTPGHGDRVKNQISTFTEQGHVEHQIKGNRECSNMVVNSFPADPTQKSPLRVG